MSVVLGSWRRVPVGIFWTFEMHRRTPLYTEATTHASKPFQTVVSVDPL